MKTPEYEEILAALQEVVAKAYALGRSDALKRVISAMQEDQPEVKTLALMAPAEPAPETVVEHPVAAHSAVVPEPVAAEPVAEAEAAPPAERPSAWWAKPPRRPPPAPPRGRVLQPR